MHCWERSDQLHIFENYIPNMNFKKLHLAPNRQLLYSRRLEPEHGCIQALSGVRVHTTMIGNTKNPEKNKTIVILDEVSGGMSIVSRLATNQVGPPSPKSRRL